MTVPTETSLGVSPVHIRNGGLVIVSKTTRFKTPLPLPIGSKLDPLNFNPF